MILYSEFIVICIFRFEGKFLTDFMTCVVPANHLNHPSEHFSIINITSTDSSVQESAMEGDSLESMNKLYIPHHYICLRARLSRFPAALSHDGFHGECLIYVKTIHIYSELSIFHGYVQLMDVSGIITLS